MTKDDKGGRGGQPKDDERWRRGEGGSAKRWRRMTGGGLETPKIGWHNMWTAPNSLRRSTPAGPKGRKGPKSAGWKRHLSMITVLLILHVPLPLHNNEKKYFVRSQTMPTHLSASQQTQTGLNKKVWICVQLTGPIQIVCIRSWNWYILTDIHDLSWDPRCLKIKDGTAKKPQRFQGVRNYL